MTTPVRQVALDERVRPEVYLLFDDLVALDPGQASTIVRRIDLLIGAHGRTADALDRVTRGLRTFLPDVRVRGAALAQDLVDAKSFASWFMAAGAGLFASVSLLLVIVGFHARTAHELESRRRELALRRALGATPRRMTREVIVPVLIAAASGLLLGCVGLVVATGAIGAIVPKPPEVTDPSRVALALSCGSALCAVIVVTAGLALRSALAIAPSRSLRSM